MQKSTILVLVLIAMTIKTNAQLPHLVWDKTYGSVNDFNQSLDCAADNSGNVFVVGYTTFWPHGDFLIHKYNAASGNIIWTKTFDGNPSDTSNNNDIAMGCTVDASGNLFVTGMSANSSGNNDIMTIKYNGSSGDTLWTRRWNGAANGYDAGTKCVLDANGNLYVTGLSYSGVYTDFCMLKYNAVNGNLIWSHNYPSPLGNKGEAYGCSLNGSNIFINGYIYSGTSYKLYTVKCNTSNGDTVWTRVNNEGLDSLKFIHSDCSADNSGNVYVVGNCSSNTKGVYARIIKYNSSGAVVWSKVFENPEDNTSNDALYGCTLDKGGNLIATGTTNGSSTYLNHFITLRYNAATGDTIWSKTYIGRGGVSCDVDNDGNLYVTGAPEEWQCLILKYDNIGAASIADNQPNLFNNAYPNPASDNVMLNIDNSKNDLILNIYNATGELIRTELFSANQRLINTGDLKNGVYILEAKSGDWIERQRIVVER